MSKHDPQVILAQIALYAERAQELSQGHSAHDFTADWKQGMLFERVMENLGEAVKRLPDELRERYDAIDWKAISGMRDRLSHGYDSVDYDILLRAVERQIPSLLETIRQMQRDWENPS